MLFGETKGTSEVCIPKGCMGLAECSQVHPGRAHGAGTASTLQPGPCGMDTRGPDSVHSAGGLLPCQLPHSLGDKDTGPSSQDKSLFPASTWGS